MKPLVPCSRPAGPARRVLNGFALAMVPVGIAAAIVFVVAVGALALVAWLAFEMSGT
jgi:hypothetical protein